MTLLYVSKVDGVDWAAGTITVTGIGLPPANAANATIRREMARRAALADARRKLVSAIAAIKTGPDRDLEPHREDKNFSRKIEGFIQGYRVTAERESSQGRIEIDLELPLTGQNGLSRYVGQ